jgi:hypothetical protein
MKQRAGMLFGIETLRTTSEKGSTVGSIKKKINFFDEEINSERLSTQKTPLAHHLKLETEENEEI